MYMTKKTKYAQYILVFLFLMGGGLLLLFTSLRQTSELLEQSYRSSITIPVYDTNGEILTQRKLNSLDPTPLYLLPSSVEKALLEQEDNIFYWHPGFNPWSILRAGYNTTKGKRNVANSTITQQIVKILLQNQNDRTWRNKVSELWYSFVLEIFYSKQEILSWYASIVPVGQNIHGLHAGAQFYFNRNISSLSDDQVIELIATLPCPSVCNPFSQKTRAEKQNTKRKYHNTQQSPAWFESERICSKNTCDINAQITEDLRSILQKNLEQLIDKNVEHGAIVVLNTNGNPLALVGSPDPRSERHGYQIDMSRQPRAVGSTLKPLLYALGFDAGLRPYSVITDREYKYTTADGFGFYPKNYNLTYAGDVTARYALANSLNAPAVQVYSFVGGALVLRPLFDFMGVTSRQPLEAYQLGIPLGGAEMSPQDLAQLYQLLITPNPHLSPAAQAMIYDILQDRHVRVDQFGNSIFPRQTTPIAIKTGTSREYKDSWAVAYNPEYIIVVWLGNADETPMKQVSGSSGAGIVMRQVLEYLIATNIFKEVAFDDSMLTSIGGDIGLITDDVSYHRDIILDSQLILQPHNGDEYKLGGTISLRSRQPSTWHINGDILKSDTTEVKYTPDRTGMYTITATTKDEEETIIFSVLP